MTIFNDWLTHFNNKIKHFTLERQILLLVDYASAHKMNANKCDLAIFTTQE